MLELQAHPVNQAPLSKVTVAHEMSSHLLKVSFNVITPTLFTESKFSLDHWDNWGLWDYDVVEVFLTRAKDLAPYLELQLSPLGHKFALLISRPREDYEKIKNLDVQTTTQMTSDGFKAEFSIPLEIIPGDSKEIMGNFHACLGKESSREFFAWNLNPESTPDFHRPDFFQLIGVING